MPFIEIKIIEGEISKEETEKLIKDVTDAVALHVGENLRGAIRVAVQEIKSGYYGVGGKAIGLEDIRAMQKGQ